MLFIHAAVLLAVVCEPQRWHPCTELNGDAPRVWYMLT